jgi:3-deoxy-D-manno-octulosonic-acid transferase
MFIVYDLIFLIISIFYLPVYILRGKFQPGFSARLGKLPKDLTLDSPIWIHAVSVGEAQAVRVLAQELRKEYPAKKLVISTVTATGNKIAKTIAKDGDLVTYLPLDFSFFVKNVIDKVKPAVFILAETEIWPNLISYLHKKHIPIIVVNVRISDASFKGYCMVKFLAKPILNKITFFCAQTERDAERLRGLGVAPDKIKVTGNMKFDIAIDVQKDYSSYKTKLGLLPQEKLFVAGSTHPQEEEIILDTYQELCANYPNLKLFLAPRHPERAKDIEKIVSGAGFRPVLVSQLPLAPCNCIAKPVFILDSIGELNNFYAIADIVFIGGSLVKIGGHNILEPAVFAKPILFGPQMFNFRDIAELFLNKQAAILVGDKLALKEAVRDLLNDPDKSAQLSRRAKKLIENNRGSSMRNTEVIKSESFIFHGIIKKQEENA